MRSDEPAARIGVIPPARATRPTGGEPAPPASRPAPPALSARDIPGGSAGRARSTGGGPSFDRLLDAAATVAGTLSAAAGVLLVARRLAGAIPGDPGPLAVLAVCGVGLGLLAVAVAAVRRGCPPLPAALARLGLLLGVAAVTLPLRLPSPGAAFITLTAIGLTVAALLATRSGAFVRRPTAAATPPAAPREPEAAAVAGGHADGIAGVDAAITPVPPVGAVSQRFERRTLADGCERVDGMIRVAVPRGSRLGWGHVGFCPPFTVSPTVEVATGYDAVEATVSAAEVLPWGVRIEVRLDEPAEETLDIPVDVAARAAA